MSERGVNGETQRITHNPFENLLYSQAKVEDAVRAVGLSVGSSHFFNKVGQCRAQLSRVTQKDVFFNFNWITRAETTSQDKCIRKAT